MKNSIQTKEISTFTADWLTKYKSIKLVSKNTIDEYQWTYTVYQSIKPSLVLWPTLSTA